MKKVFLLAVLCTLVGFGGIYAAGVSNVTNDTNYQSGTTTTFESGSTADIAGTLKIGGTAVTATAAQINAATGGALTNIDAGASGTAGSVDIFPTTASKGKTAFTATDNTGNTTTTITNVAQAAARTYTIPDAGASGRFITHAGIVGDGLVELITEEATVTVSGAETATGLTFPAGCIPWVAQGNIQSLVTATTAVKIGLDATGGGSAFGLTGALTKNTKLSFPVSGAGFGGFNGTSSVGWPTASTPLFLVACDNAGAAAGTLDSGTVRVRISYWKVSDLVNAP